MKTASRIFGLIALSITQFAWSGAEVALSAKQAQALGITTAALPAKQSGDVSGLPAQVVIPANQMVVVSTPLPAMVEQTLAGVGDSVRKGQTIARLQSPALAEAQRGLLQANVQSQLARENLIRDEALWKDGIIAESRYRSAKGAALEAQAALSERRQVLRLAGLSDGAIAQLQSGSSTDSLLVIAAPIDGVVLEKSASAGQRLDAAVPMFRIARLDQLALEIQAPPAYTRNLKIGATVTVPAYAASGKLTAIGRSLSGGNQTVLLRAIIQQGAENLHPGQFVEASIGISASNGAQWDVPNSAISRISGKAVVFVETAKGFRAQDINVLNEGAQNSVISGALKGDEKIAVRGVSSLKASVMGIGGGE
ncbi:MAG: efflux RND transporter periplasmic adaptor subunit [Gallionellaceae bacterium]|jgi:RND family efflux transporter MFP subunit|nr:efflux RND transporter periplasmic adaptor subunit [Gallionellaceae bacterium]